MSKEISGLEDLTPDKRNANKGTERGHRMLSDSLEKLGAGRSILVDRGGRVIAGNKTLEVAADMGLEVVTVKSDGTKLVVVQREDLDLEGDGRARQLAYADNRVGEVDLAWEAEKLLEDAESLDLDWLWAQEEIERLGDAVDAEPAGFPPLPDGDREPFQNMTFTVSDQQAETVRSALSKAKKGGPFENTGNENSNGNALDRICEAYLGG